VDTENPWCAQSIVGETRFEVLREQIIELPEGLTT
jgi:hypothetical protein